MSPLKEADGGAGESSAVNLMSCIVVAFPWVERSRDGAGRTQWDYSP